MPSFNTPVAVDDNAIESIVQEIFHFRQYRRVEEADQLKRKLLNQHSVRVFYRRDGTIGWTKVDANVKPTKKIVEWSIVDVGIDAHNKDEPLSSCHDVPLVIVTVNTPYYRSRLAETTGFLSNTSFGDGTRFKPITAVDMLNLSDHPSIGANRIVFEGWRQILLRALSRYEFTNNERSLDKDQSVVFIAEDDLRLCDVSPGRIRDACTAVFADNPDIHILSLGHAHSPAKPSRRQRRRAKRQQSNNGHSGNNISMGATHAPRHSLLQHVNSGKGLHGATLLALRHLEGIKSLLDAMEALPSGKRCHFDQFLFHSNLHDIGIAFSDPSLAGWAEVSETLTSVGSGCRRNGGGRLGQLSDGACGDGIQWVRRTLNSD